MQGVYKTEEGVYKTEEGVQKKSNLTEKVFPDVKWVTKNLKSSVDHKNWENSAVLSLTGGQLTKICILNPL